MAHPQDFRQIVENRRNGVSREIAALNEQFASIKSRLTELETIRAEHEALLAEFDSIIDHSFVPTEFIDDPSISETFGRGGEKPPLSIADAIRKFIATQENNFRVSDAFVSVSKIFPEVTRSQIANAFHYEYTRRRLLRLKKGLYLFPPEKRVNPYDLLVDGDIQFEGHLITENGKPVLQSADQRL